MAETIYRAKGKRKTLYISFRQVEHLPELSVVTTPRTPCAYTVNTFSVEKVVGDKIYHWDKEKGWYPV